MSVYREPGAPCSVCPVLSLDDYNLFLVCKTWPSLLSNDFLLPMTWLGEREVISMPGGVAFVLTLLGGYSICGSARAPSYCKHFI